MQAHSQERSWTDWPAALLGWLAIVSILLAFDIGLDRTFFTDQQNYIDNFYNAVDLNWARAILAPNSLVRGLLVAVFSEEGLWQVWATAMGWLFEPSTAVVVTVCVITVLIGFAVVRLSDPVLPLILWLLLPVGFATIGLLQLRQGFAFALMLYIALRLERPVLATLVAAMIHSTFVLVLPFALISRLCGRRYLLATSLTVALACSVAVLGNELFEVFGGRRLRIYSIGDSGSLSIFYVFGALLCVLPSLHRLFVAQSPEESDAQRRVLANIATMHVGVTAFVVISFFIFPLGAGRVGYLVMLLLIPILPAMQRRDGGIGSALFSILTLYMVYLTAKSALEGTYDVYFAG